MKRVELFRTGKQVDADGVELDVTEAVLDKIVGQYKPSFHEAPAVIGHPKDTAPAYGWVERIYREGSKLLGDFKQVQDGFAEAVKSGAFKKRSISLYPDMSLRHVAFLGAVPPAIKGMADIQFNEDPKARTFEFSEGDSLGFIARIGVLLRNMREMIIANNDLATADSVLPNSEIDNLTSAADQATDTGLNYNEPAKQEDTNMPTVEELQKQLDEAKAKITQFSEANDKTAKELADLKAEKDKLARESRRKDNISFCEGLTKAGKLPPAVVPRVLDFMDVLANTATYDFAEGDGKKTSAPVDEFKAMLGGLGKVIEFNEVATADKAAPAPATDFDAKVLEFSENGKVSKGDAMARAAREFPTLHKQWIDAKNKK